ncbi:MAG: nucleoside monophosphate kinase [Myxococcales bacterium]
MRALRERVELKSPEEVARIREAALVVHDVLQEVIAAVAPGVTTLHLDAVAERATAARGAKPAFKGYHGYPRTTAQADYLEALLASLGRTIDRVLSYEVAEELIVERISGRRSCPKCGTVYHVSANPPRRMGYCDKDDQALVQRDDDKPENVKKRMQEYADKTRPLKRFYEDRKLVSEIEGVGTPEGILAATKVALGGRA